MIKYMIMDLDGTLLNDIEEIGDLTVKEILRLRSEGMHFIIASGRRLAGIIEYAKVLNFGKDDYIISCDGEYIYDGAYKEIWRNKFISQKELNQIINSNIKGKIIVFTQKNDFIFNVKFFEKLVRKVWYWYKKNERIIFATRTDLIRGNVEKIRIGANNKGDIVESLSSLTFHKVFDKYIDITSENVNKLYAIALILRKLKVSKSEVVYFGDDYNDIECFTNLHNTVAVKNAQEEILKKAKFITASNNENGVGWFLTKIKEGSIFDD